MVYDGANKSFRLIIRGAGFGPISAMGSMGKGHMLADVVTVIGTMDVVFGEIDR